MTTRTDVLNEARKWIGLTDKAYKDNAISRRWGIVGQDYCAATVSTWFEDAGATLPAVQQANGFTFVPCAVNYARNNGQAIEVYAGNPEPGDVVLFAWDGNRWATPPPSNMTWVGKWWVGDHVGVVESYDGGSTVVTLEGNTTGQNGEPRGFHRRVRALSTVACWWRPPVYTDDPFAPAAVVEEDVTEDDRRFIQKVVADGIGDLRSAIAVDTRTLLQQNLQPTDVKVDVDKLADAVARKLLAGLLSKG